MNTRCDNCGKQLKLNEKMLQSIKSLEAGKTIRVKCPGCKNIIALDQSIIAGSGHTEAPAPPKSHQSGALRPPGAPDISWLAEGTFEEEQVIEDVPLAMILMQDSPQRTEIVKSIEGIGYRTEMVANASEAIEKMLFTEYSAVVLHETFEAEGISGSKFHAYMRHLEMSRRRFMFYVLVGKSFKTLYNLQALSYSANLVVNDREIPYFDVIIRKAIPDYEELFGPITEEMRIHGK